jgi:hypothetical protein
MARKNQSMRVGLRRIVIVVCAAICSHVSAQGPPPPAVAMPQPVMQASGTVVKMPMNLKVSRRFGLNLDVDTRWVNAYGYRPVEVTISSPIPTAAAHTITVELHSGWNSVVTAQQDFEFPAGATKASTIIALPFYEQSYFRVWWDIRVDGVKDVDLSIDKDDASQTFSNSNVSAATVRVLVTGSEANQKSVVSTNVSDFEVFTLTPGSFPRRWIEYTCLDVVSLSITDLEDLAATNPAALESIERWVRTGGQLWVCDVGAELENLPAVSKRLKVPEGLVYDAAVSVASDPKEKPSDRSNAEAKLPDSRPAEVGWRPGRSRGGGPFGQAQGFTDIRSGKIRWVAPRDIPAIERDPNYVRSNEAPAPDDTNGERRQFESSQWYVEQRLGLGALRAFRGPNEAARFARGTLVANLPTFTDPNPDNSQLPRALTTALRSTRHWDTRHGLIPDSSNADFAKLLLPDVGRAPVTEFQVLITLFVLLIGPFNYWILKRYKRLHLLVLTVPLSAGVATAALFLYAIVADGFATRVRVRSYTTIDQPTGEAACWARMSYYAGLAPGKGLTMPADLVMYPILPSWGSDDWGTTREMVWDENSQLLTRGWLTSRTPTQYLMVRSCKTPHRLDVTSGNGKMQVVNRLGTRIDSLLVLDDAGKLFSGRELASESRVALEPISRDDAVKRIVDLMRDSEPEMPAELSGSDRDFLGRRGRSTRRIYSRFPRQQGEGQLNDNIANRALSDLAGMNGRPALDLPARSYVAVTATGPEVETGISYATENASFHVVVGRW